MRLFVYVALIIFAVVFVSVNQVAITSAISGDDSFPLPSCVFEDIGNLGDISARSWQVVDLQLGKVLVDYEPDTILPFASIVKLITAHVVQQEPATLLSTTSLTYEDIATEGRSGNLQVGEKYTHHELLFPLLVTSSNDAGAALARVYPNIISEMQNFVSDSGATNTTIFDTTGLSNGNRTTVSDLSLLLRELYHHSPHTFDITRTSQIISQYGTGWLNNIPFRSLSGYRGGKQGYTHEALQTGVAVFATEGLSPKVFGISILGSDNVAKDMATLHSAVMQSYYCEPFSSAE
jgi:D-alanyl-D-alanine carboxypeptidase